jgi:hypothetical protein
VFDAILSKPYDIKERQVREWTELPAHVAAAEFRNSISKETYNSLFEPQSPTKYQINHFKQDLARRIQHMGVIAYQFVENKDGSQMQTGQTWEKSKLNFSERRNLQTPKPLRSRGIKVISADFSELEPTHQDVSSHLTNYWRSEWQKETAIIEADFELQAARLKSFAGAEIQTDLVNTLGMILQDRPLPKEVLSFKVFQALEAAASDPETRRLLPEEVMQMLSEIRNLLLPEDSTAFFEESTEKIDSETSSQESVDEDKSVISNDPSNDKDTGNSLDSDSENF